MHKQGAQKKLNKDIQVQVGDTTMMRKAAYLFGQQTN